MNIINAAFKAGAALMIVGLYGYFVGGRVSETALIPAFFGLPILLSGFWAKKNLKMGMHVAALFGLLGFIAPLGRVIPQAIKGEFDFDLAGSAMVAMSLICLTFVLQCVQSFKAARREKAEAAE